MIDLIAAGFFYLDIGISTNSPFDDVYLNNDYCACVWTAPLAEVEAGYTVETGNKNFFPSVTVFGSHKSSLVQKEIGLNEIGIKARVLKW